MATRKRNTETPAPAPEPAQDWPTEGGTWERDPDTGALKRVDEPEKKTDG